MCKLHFKGETGKYKFLLDLDGKAAIVDLATGELLPKEDAFKIWTMLNNAFEKSLCPEAVKPKKEKSEVVRHKHGEYGWVRLTDEEYARLVEDFGEDEVKSCIEYVDVSAETTGNKNKWKNWNLVVRKCHRENWHHKPTNKIKPQNDIGASYDMDLFKKRANALPVYESNK